MYQQLWGYKVEEILYMGVREQKRLNTTALEHPTGKKCTGVRSDDRGGYFAFSVLQ
jgi:hypothetical protein